MQNTWRTIWRIVLIPTFLAILLGLWIDDSQPDPSQFYTELVKYDALPAMSSRQVSASHELKGMRSTQDSAEAETTAVILNWSRFPNVLLISSLLCGPWLDGIIKEVVIWNNSPSKIYYSNFQNTGCTRQKLRIHNSPENVYFQARFLACARANTLYCFIQDDDYLIRSEVIRTLHARLIKSRHPHTIHLLPPHEHLSTALREIHIPRIPSGIHTSFAWLGHGTMLHRSEAVDFLSLMGHLNASDDEMKMADNFYTILSNRVPEVWFDQGVELGGGMAFTVGEEGETRNAKYIIQASRYLESILRYDKTGLPSLPYVSSGPKHITRPDHVTRAVCKDVACLLETNIALLPANMSHTGSNISDILRIGAANLESLSDDSALHYILYAPSRAVDQDRATFFESAPNAAVGDYIMLQFVDSVVSHGTGTMFEMKWVVNPDTERILQRNTLFKVSSDGKTWLRVRTLIQCNNMGDSEAGARDPSSAARASIRIRECNIGVETPSSVGGDSIASAASPAAIDWDDVRYVRAEVVRRDDLEETLPQTRWRVHEIVVAG